MSRIPAGSALRCPCSLVPSACEKSEVCKELPSDRSTEVVPLQGSHAGRGCLEQTTAALCDQRSKVLRDHRAKGLRPLGTHSSPHPVMPLSTKHCTSSTLNLLRYSGLGHHFLNENKFNFNCIIYG